MRELCWTDVTSQKYQLVLYLRVETRRERIRLRPRRTTQMTTEDIKNVRHFGTNKTRQEKDGQKGEFIKKYFPPKV